MENFTIKTPQEIKVLKEGGKILARIIKELAQAAQVGVSTLDLENLAQKLIKKAGVKPSFQGFGSPPFPAAICASNNEAIVHGIPNKEKLKDGDLLGIDMGIWHKGLCTDMAVTVGIGEISKESKKLLEATKKSLQLAISQVAPGKTLGDLGFAVQSYAESRGFGVVRELVGHGVGYEVHEPPQVPNFGKPGQGLVLEAGMVLAIEPMLTMGDYRIEVMDNSWDIVTKDRSLAAHFEHTIAVTKKGVEILTE